jgi:hypothetical protein
MKETDTAPVSPDLWTGEPTLRQCAPSVQTNLVEQATEGDQPADFVIGTSQAWDFHSDGARFGCLT